MEPFVSLAIETSCRLGGLALGRGEDLVRVLDFDASTRHATQLVTRMDELLRADGLRAADLDELYVSAGPGSFTGTRVGVTVARTLAQVLPHVRCVAVHTPLAVAENVRDRPWDHLGVMLDAREDCIYGWLLERRGEDIVPVGEPRIGFARDFLSAAPRPLLLVGEGLAYHDLSAEGVTPAFPTGSPRHLPTAASVWRVGRRLARAEQFTEYHGLLPVYARAPEAVRLWEKRHRPGQQDRRGG